jgi:hypothetical protein
MPHKNSNRRAGDAAARQDCSADQQNNRKNNRQVSHSQALSRRERGANVLIVDGHHIEQRGECESCGRKLCQRRSGRNRRFCSARCRQAAYRRAADPYFVTNLTEGKGALRIASKSPTKSATFNPEKQGRGSGFSIPANLVVGHRFPDAKPVDLDLAIIIMRTESHLQADDDTAVQLTKWKPASNINPADVPDIPDFLLRPIPAATFVRRAAA